ncbi:hypothetical protein BOBR111200_12120 [Bordetella bronchialis]
MLTAMNNSLYVVALTTAFNIFVACFFVAAVSLITIWFFKLDRINDVLRHPLLQHRPFRQFPRAIQAGIFLDYFLRLLFPRARKGLFGQANRNLAHVDPARVPMDVKWPIMGLWAGCWIGLAAMITVWTLLLLRH